ncbi:hypothetical protein H5410_031351 [Solanum commersonii]|uniref:Uncharacterized protein n=1 Tax=Solanum commersonii TaxID=4109 RepID=A0A9J5YIX0_SOLCO|nr:hypothetical protein H5410_031351 [Solanum commersonii]
MISFNHWNTFSLLLSLSLSLSLPSLSTSIKHLMDDTIYFALGFKSYDEPQLQQEIGMTRQKETGSP